MYVVYIIDHIHHLFNKYKKYVFACNSDRMVYEIFLLFFTYIIIYLECVDGIIIYSLLHLKYYR